MFGKAACGSGGVVHSKWLVVDNSLHHDLSTIDEGGVVGGEVGGEMG